VAGIVGFISYQRILGTAYYGRNKTMPPKWIGFLGFDGVTACHLVGPADSFAAAALDDGYGNRISCYQLCIIGVNSGSFRAESGLLFKAQETLQTAPELDTIVIPGGEGLRRAEVSEKISDWVLTRANRTRRIAAICTGIYGVAPTGLLDGREVTTHWRFASDVARRFPSLRVDHRRPLVKDGPFYTSACLTAAMDLSLALIEEDYGRQVALAAAREPAAPVNRNGEQDFSRPVHFDSQPIDRFAELVRWIMLNLDQDLSVNALARRACMSPSHFNRAFKSVFGSTPTEFVENLRVNEARRRLSTPKRTLDSIAASVGFSDREAFRRAFERRFGAKPRGYLTNLDSNGESRGNSNCSTSKSSEF
jgi:transcriptional regulator GlxA family with amidase domain